MRKTSTVIGLLVLAATGLSSASAGAQEKKKGGDYEYWFEDDPMQAASGQGTIPQIRVMQSRRRDALMRPRTAFVTELLKSVEGM